MKKIILFYGSFDPIHQGHIKIAEEAIKLIKGDKLYFGLNKNSNSKNLAPFSKRKDMVKLAIDNKSKFDVINIKFDYTNLDDTYDKILSFCNDNNEYYILIGQDQLDNLNKWYKFNILKKKFKFIIATRHYKEDKENPNYIYLNNKIYNVSSSEIKAGNYKGLHKNVKQYIVENNVYLNKQLKQYLSSKRIKHVESVKNLALKIYKNNNEGLDKNKIVTACLLHDIARELPKDKLKYIIKNHYPNKINELAYIYHQYAGEYLAKKKFFIEDKDILEAIKWHTTGNENMSKLAKLVYICDKLDPLRGYDSSELIQKCINNLDEGFMEVLKDKINYSLKKDELKTISNYTKKAIKYYLKGENIIC